MSILALDLGTDCGFALKTATDFTFSGAWSLKSKRVESVGMRYIRFREQLDKLHAAEPITLIYFEEVRRHAGVDAAHMYGGYLAVLQAWCIENAIEYQGVPVQEIKKSWTGSAVAPKDDEAKEARNKKARAKGKKEYTGTSMVGEARRRGYDPVSDDEADAIAILVLKTEGGKP